MQETLPSTGTSNKPIEFGTGLTKKYLDDKIIICAENTTKIRQGTFLLEGKEVVVEGDRGIKITSRHPNVLIISYDSTKMEETLYDIKKDVDNRLKVIEAVFSRILKEAKK